MRFNFCYSRCSFSRMREIFWGLGDRSLIMVALVRRILGADLVITVDERSDRSVKSLLFAGVFLGSSLLEVVTA
jgi:hypothetical protein